MVSAGCLKPYRVSFLSGAGGVGKSTAVMYLARAFAALNYRTGVVDLNPHSAVATLMGKEDLAEVGFSNAFDFPSLEIVLVDTPLDLSGKGMRDAIAESDLLCLVTTPTSYDLEATGRVFQAVTRLGGKEIRVMWNRWSRANESQGEPVEELKAVGLEQVLRFQAKMSDRTAYTYDKAWKSLGESLRCELKALAGDVLAARDITLRG